MGFLIPELIVESIIRDGLLNVRTSPEVIDDVFSQLTKAYADRKYGEAELTKIKAMVDKDIPVLYSYHQVDAMAPAISIMVGTDNEDRKRDHLDDHYEEAEYEIVDEDELEALHRVDNLQVLSFDNTTGKVTVTDTTDLSPVYKGMIYVDSGQTEHTITGGIDNTVGNKSFFINKLDEVDISDATGFIKSSLNYKRYEIRGVTNDVQLVIGIHTKDALMTKYLYVLIKYFLVSRKKDMIKRGLYVSMHNGSDFNLNSSFVGDQVYTRFLTLTGKEDNTWRSDQVILIDNVVIEAVPVECNQESD